MFPNTFILSLNEIDCIVAVVEEQMITSICDDNSAKLMYEINNALDIMLII